MTACSDPRYAPPPPYNASLGLLLLDRVLAKPPADGNQRIAACGIALTTTCAIAKRLRAFLLDSL
jgi:hypothetical protein